MTKKKFIIISSVFIICAFIYHLQQIPERTELNSHLVELNNGDIKFKFTIGKLIQGVDCGDLPFHYYLHPDAKVEFKPANPGVVTAKDFLIWVGSNFKNQLSKEDRQSKELEEKGLVFVKHRAEKGFRAFQMILSSYFLYFKNDTKKGLFWAERAAEQGETGSMVILGDAYMNSIGVVQNKVEGLQWYMIASSLGDLAAQGRLLASFSDISEKKEERKLAMVKARAWMEAHKKHFISAD